MPILRREFEAGRSGPEFAIIELLRVERDQAFTALELWQYVYERGYSLDIFDLQRLLEELVQRGEITDRIVIGLEGQLRYYMYGRRMGFQSSSGR